MGSALDIGQSYRICDEIAANPMPTQKAIAVKDDTQSPMG